MLSRQVRHPWMSAFAPSGVTHRTRVSRVPPMLDPGHLVEASWAPPCWVVEEASPWARMTPPVTTLAAAPRAVCAALSARSA